MDASRNRSRPLSWHLGERRKQLGLTRAEAAGLVGVGRMAWYEWEAGRRIPRDSNYVHIDKAMQWEPGGTEVAVSGAGVPVNLPPKTGDPLKDPAYLKARASFDLLVEKYGFATAKDLYANDIAGGQNMDDDENDQEDAG